MILGVRALFKKLKTISSYKYLFFILSFIFFQYAAATVPIVPIVPIRAYNKANSFELVFSWGKHIPYQIEEKKGTVTILFDQEADYKPIGFMDLPDFISKINVKNKEGSLYTEVSVIGKPQLSHKWLNQDLVITLVKTSPDKKEKLENTNKMNTQKTGKSTELTTDNPPLPSKLSIVLEKEKNSKKSQPKIDILRLKTSEDLRIAALQRGKKLFIVVDKSVLMDFSQATPEPDSYFSQFKQLDISNSAILEIDLVNSPHIYLEKEKDGWVIKLSAQEVPIPQITTKNLSPAFSIHASQDRQSSLNLKMNDTPVIYTIQDPLTNLPLVLIPIADSFVDPLKKYTDFEILNTLHGVAILSKADTLLVTLNQNTLQLSTLDGMHVSSDQDRVSQRIIGKPEPLLSYDTEFIFEKKPLQTALELYTHTLSKAKGLEKDVQRLDYVFYLLSKGLYMEAYGQIRLLEMEKPNFFLLPKYLCLKVMTAVLAERFDVAAKTLENKFLKDEEDIQLWKAAVRAHAYKIQEAYELFFHNLSKFQEHPPYVLSKLIQLSLRVALLLDKNPKPFLQKAKGLKFSPQEQDYLKFCHGKELAFSQQNVKALDIYRGLIKNSAHPDIRIKAELARIQLELKLDTLKTKDAVQQLEKVRFAWSGDETTRDSLKLLGNLYLKDKKYEKAISAYKEIQETLSHIPGSEEATEKLKDMYADAILRTDYKDPMDLVSFYKEYLQYLPQDDRKKEIFLKVLHAYAELGLPEDVELLIKQIAKIAFPQKNLEALNFLLAEVYERIGKYDKSLQILLHDLSSNLPKDIDFKRKILLVKLYTSEKNYDKALEILTQEPKIPNHPLIMLQIAWEKKDWAILQGILKEQIHTSPLPSSFPEDHLMKYTLAAYQTGDEKELTYLRQHLEKQIKSPINKAMFHLLTSEKEPTVFTDETVTQALNEAQTYASWGRGYMGEGKSNK